MQNILSFQSCACKAVQICSKPGKSIESFKRYLDCYKHPTKMNVASKAVKESNSNSSLLEIQRCAKCDLRRSINHRNLVDLLVNNSCNFWQHFFISTGLHCLSKQDILLQQKFGLQQ
ncbi:unnamed protein product [Caenorhabditis angaria]|uniref:Uncharacterized protein n=1 Tax=Caenorhabditis angaria TaxID=860376 RepID=A0A9P1IKB1_9PELO|nr:unnamed protein product [Caenorhabditis angaria]